MKRINFLFVLSFLVWLLVSCGPKDGTYRIDIYSTNDVHGHYFDSVYTSDKVQLSLANVSTYIKGERERLGEDNVVLIDVGDILQGDNAAYYYNYVDTVSEHVYSKASRYMGYDAAVVGNHDIETGHPVYDRMVKELDMPFLAANAIDTLTGSHYFQDYVILDKGGIKVAVIGFTNPNIKGWLSEELWSGLRFESIIPFAQSVVDRVREKEDPDIVVVAMHSGTGDGDTTVIENQALAALRTLDHVDVVLCAHDHRSTVIEERRNIDGKDSLVSVLVNGGSHCREVGHTSVELVIEGGKVVSKKISSELVPMDGYEADKEYLGSIRQEYEAVRAFTLKETGRLSDNIYTRDAFKGRALYTDLLHTLQLSCEPAQISFAAPLTYNKLIPAGVLNFQDLFSIYPFENQLFVVKMTGKEIKDAMEFSYDKWINTLTDREARKISKREVKDVHALAIVPRSDKRTGSVGYSFANRSYNFDSAAGICYTVDLTRPYGEKVCILSMADGSEFNMDSTYNVAMTSYRASGGGGILKAAGIDTDNIDDRVVARYPEIRNILYDYLKEHGEISPKNVSDESLLGDWKFLPDGIDKAIERDFNLLFRK